MSSIFIGLRWLKTCSQAFGFLLIDLISYLFILLTPLNTQKLLGLPSVGPAISVPLMLLSGAGRGKKRDDSHRISGRKDERNLSFSMPFIRQFTTLTDWLQRLLELCVCLPTSREYKNSSWEEGVRNKTLLDMY